MQKDEILAIFDEFIQVELNVAALYKFLQEIFPQDSDFWWQLAVEEKNHAALLKSGKIYFNPVNQFPLSLIIDSKERLEKTNAYLTSLIQRWQEEKPSRQEAFNTALQIERSAAEAHFQLFMEKTPESEIEKVFQELNQNDKDHAQRINKYMQENGIAIL